MNGDPTPLRADVRAKILGAARGRPSPTRADLARTRALAAFVSAAWLLVAASFGHARPEGASAILFAVWLALAVGVSAYVLRTPASSLGRPRVVLALIGPAAGALVVLASVIGGLLMGHATDHHHGEVACWTLTVGIAAVPLAAGLWVERRSDPIAPGASGAAIGAIAGAWSSVAMAFVCGRSETAHVLVGHVLGVIAVVAVAAVVGRRVLMLR